MTNVPTFSGRALQPVVRAIYNEIRATHSLSAKYGKTLRNSLEIAGHRFFKLRPDMRRCPKPGGHLETGSNSTNTIQYATKK
jgi:hypothetical protein